MHMKLLRHLIRGNLGWMVRRLIGGLPSEPQEEIDMWIAQGIMNPPDEFTRRRHYEARKSKNKQHS